MSNLDTNHVINLDLVKDRVNSVIKFGLADVETSDFYLGLYNNGSRVFDKDYIVTLYIVKPNGTFRNVELEPKEGLKKYYCNLPDTLKNIPGEYLCQAIIFDNLTGEKKISKSKFKYSVDLDLASEMAGIIDEEEQESILTNILNRLLTLENPVEPYATQKHVDECVSTLTEEIDTIEAKDIEQDGRLTSIETKDAEQDNRLDIAENRLNNIDNDIIGVNQRVDSVATFIPTNTSQLTNDSDFATNANVNEKIANAQLGNKYVTKETGNANQITFSDGETFQTKLDAGTLKGPKGDTGAKGEKGDKGEPGEQGIQGVAGVNGQDGADGATFTPSVDTEGNLSWTNDKGLVNPPTVNIKGEKGDSGVNNIDDNNASLTTTYSSNKIETIKEDLSSQIKDKTSKQELELIDARIAITGDVYSNVGSAIRGQLNCLELMKSKNLFDKENILENTRLVTWNSPNKINETYTKDGSYTSPIIEVEAGKQYCFISNGSICALSSCIAQMTYDESGNHVRNITPKNNIYTIDDGECYIRFTTNAPFANDLCFKEHTEGMSLQYEEYGKSDSNRMKTLENNVKTLENNVKLLEKIQFDNITVKSILNKDNLNRQIISIGDYICSLSDSIPANNEQFFSIDLNIKKYSDETAKIHIPIGNQNTSIKISKNINVSFDEGDVMCIFFYVDWDSVDSNTKTVSSPIYSIRFYYTGDDGVEVEKRLNYYEIIRGWQMVKIPFSKATNINNISCYVQPNSNEMLNDIIVNFDSVFKNYRMKPCILLNFDNMLDSNIYGVVYPLLESFGFKGTFYLSGKSELGGAYISKSHFDEMIDNGWDYAFYGPSGSTYGYNSDYETAYSSVKEIVDYRRETDGIPLPISWFCQNGQTSNTFSKALKDLGFKIVRGTGLPCINYFGEDSLETKFNSLDATTTSNRLEEVKSLVDKTINEGNALSVFTHQLLETPDDTGINSTVEVWTEFLTYLKSKVDAGLIEVLTYKEFYERCVRTSLVEKQFNLRNMYRIQKLENK